MVFSVPFALVVLVLGRLVIPKDRPEAGGGHDLAGAVALPAGMLTLVYTVVSAPQAGWASPRTIAGFALAAAILALFVLIESRARHPLIRFSIMKQGWVARANLAAVALFGAYLSFQTIITLFLQSVLGWQPLTLALALLPAGLIVAGSAPFADRMIDRFGAPRLIMLGLVSQVIGYLLFLRVDTHPSYPLAILPSVLLIGLGFAMAFPSINVQATAGISNSEQGLAAGLVQTSTQVGAALVLAVTTAVVAGGMPQVGAGAGQMLAAYRPGLVLSALVALAGFAVVAWPRRQGHDPEPVTDAAVPVEPEQEREPVG
jgi:predicted MFS family arabinose efflux permease